MKLDGWHDLLEDRFHVLRVLLRLAWRDLHLLHLGGAGIVLDIIHLLLLVITTKEAVGNLIEEISENSGVLVLALLERALELLDFVLSQLVGDWPLVSI